MAVHPTVQAPPSTATWPRWLLLVGAMTALGPFSIDMYLPGFPQIEAELRADGVENTMAAYLAGIGLGQLVYGPLSDRLGRKPPLYFGLLLYALGSLGCALAASMPMLLAMRVVQATGGCAALVIGRAIVRDRCEPHEAARAFSMLMLIVSIGPMLAPSLGGWVITLFDWRAVFVFQCGFGVVLFLAMHYLLSESRPPTQAARTSLTALAGHYARLLRDRALIGHSLIAALGMSALFCYVTGAPKVMIPLYQLSPQQFGWMMGVNGLAFMGASRLNVLLLRSKTPEGLVRSSLWIPPALGVVMSALALWLVRPPLVLTLILQLAFFVSVARISPNVAALGLAAHSRDAGAASAVMGLLQALVPMGAGLAIAALGDGTLVTLYLLMSVAVMLSLVCYAWTSARAPP
jgi:DHA1 family bicyclomycin/chloramphenicol resistance-like MFS transporter